MRTFERFSDIESWLREQWAGLFRELLNKQSQQQQFMALTTQVAGLKEINETLKKYLEAVMTGVGPDVSSKLIASEEKRLEIVKREERIRTNPWCEYLTRRYDLPFERVLNAITKAKSFEEFVNIVSKGSQVSSEILEILIESEAARDDLNRARKIINLDPIFFSTEDKNDDADLKVRSKNKRGSKQRST